MDALIWVLVVIALVVLIAASFAMIRHRQRSGDVLASSQLTQNETRS